MGKREVGLWLKDILVKKYFVGLQPEHSFINVSDVKCVINCKGMRDIHRKNHK